MALDDQAAFDQASGWIAALLTGSLATSVSVLAVAILGLLALSGRIPARRGVMVVIGCFVVFSAGLIAQALVGSLDAHHAPEPPPPASGLQPYVPKQPAPLPYDPYAGASVPTTQGERSIQ